MKSLPVACQADTVRPNRRDEQALAANQGQTVALRVLGLVDDRQARISGQQGSHLERFERFFDFFARRLRRQNVLLAGSFRGHGEGVLLGGEIRPVRRCRRLLRHLPGVLGPPPLESRVLLISEPPGDRQNDGRHDAENNLLHTRKVGAANQISSFRARRMCDE
jgi:hypothetical protein